MEAKCQSCIDRGLEPHDAIYSWQGQPICDVCLGPLVDNGLEIQTSSSPSGEGEIDPRKIKANEILDQLEILISSWPLTAEETLQCHEDFYNHRPPAIANLTLKQIEEVYSRRKGILFAVRHKGERWATDIENLKRKKREEANLTGIAASKREVSKRVPSDEITREKNRKLAAGIGMTLEQYEAIIIQAKVERFEKVVGAKADSKNVPFVKTTSTGEILEDLKAKIKDRQKSPVKINPITGLPYA